MQHDVIAGQRLSPAFLPVDHTERVIDPGAHGAQLTGGHGNLPARGDNVLDDEDLPPGHLRAFGQAAGAIGLGLFSDESARQPCMPAQRGHHRDPAHLKPRKHLRAIWYQRGHLLGQSIQ